MLVHPANVGNGLAAVIRGWSMAERDVIGEVPDVHTLVPTLPRLAVIPV